MRFLCNLLLLSAIILFGVTCTKDGTAAADSASGTGKGGSLARFTISGNYLYLADYNTIEVFDITDPANPVRKESVPVGFGVETIYPYKDKLFIGSVDGMYIFSIENPDKPQMLGSARHVRSCDPVVANDSIAYVTLRGGSPCGPAEDGLYVYHLKDITAPVQKALLRLSSPYGLGLKDSVVFVCRGSNGLTAVNVKNPEAPKEMYTVKDDAYSDIIPVDDILVCYVQTGILLYDASNLKSIQKIASFTY